ncbi:nitrite reductase (NADH) large subunit [Rubricella aquisinus]|uniref:Nitrite reductase (NADH) large subunit n=1 Tax=Rubricella aquisinus TaxID=2028108 RepID=A0A840WG95_9RHOB|nr:nitrite reductase large subunit NirB [Rubricella aquisinus]MBB5514178.1 nitrite reductase (NADH) large subunit [Rubricella aquisinus]
MTQHIVVIGAGMASGRMLEHLFDAGADVHVTLFGAEPRGNYNRIMLSPVLSGEKTFEEIVTHDSDWYAAHGVTTRFGEHITAVDPVAKTVATGQGPLSYDKLVIATGSDPFIIPVPGKDLPGVMAYRDLDDVERMKSYAAKPGAKAVVIGGGLLGLEAAAGLKAQGMDVTVIHLAGHLMERQLDPAAGYLLKRELELRGIKVLLEANTAELRGTDHVEAVLLKDGRVIEADMVCMAVGIRPATALGTACGIACERGIIVDDQMRTVDPDILAIGECVQHQGQIFGLVAPLYDQAKVAAKTLMGEEAAFTPPMVSTKLKVTGVDLFSAGDFADGDDREEIVFRDAARGVYKRLILAQDRIIGIVMYGDTADGPWFLQKLKDGEDISEGRDTLIFGQNYAGGAPLDPMAAVAALPDEAEICGCNGVSKAIILAAIAGGAGSLAEVTAKTKASTSCGSCAGLTAQVVALGLGDDFVIPAEAGMCGCTDHSHEDVRRLIVADGMKSIPEVMQKLHWTSSGGCAKCRPALNYYLLCAWPEEYADHAQSRFINERVHANIQKDGTYSVVPRMWGGITTPDELRAIANAADKYNVPTVKVTGGQRIDLLGVKKEDLPSMWADLNAAGMVSGHAYAKGLRTVKTCVGTDHCRFGTQDSTGLGIKIEKALWGAWSPHKFKLAVSGCPRNCAEATCKDFGVVCVAEGYQLHVGGAAGMEVKATQLMCTVATEEEAIEYCAAFYQLYREGARYLDRPWKWIDRVGLDHIIEKVVEDADSRTALAARFFHSQKYFQTDPWAERAGGKDAHEFTPLADLTQVAAE